MIIQTQDNSMILVAIQLFFINWKLTNLINWSWWVVFIPVIYSILVTILVMFFSINKAKKIKPIGNKVR